LGGEGGNINLINKAMLLKKIEELSNSYEDINLQITYKHKEWKISIEGKSEEYDDNVFIDEDLLYDILESLMEGELFTDLYGDNIGLQDYICYSYSRFKKELFLYEGQLFSDCIIIKQQVFKSELDFFLYAFSLNDEVCFSTKALIRGGIKTPFQIFVDAIELKGFKFEGFVKGEADFEGYMEYSFRLTKGGEIIMIQAPQKDLIIGMADNFFKFSDFDQLDIISYNSGFWPLLNAIKSDNLERYFAENS
jgi:hypothetical protein